jgi:DNA-binding beta-propeller fold protein YncE
MTTGFRAALGLAAGLAFSALRAQPIDMSAVRASEEFRRGIDAFHAGLMNESILSLEKALALDPAQGLFKAWLGEAYYRSGLESTALGLWQELADSGAASEALAAKAEIVRSRRLGALGAAQSRSYVEQSEFPGSSGGQKFFSKPSSVLPLESGGLIVCSFAGRELVRFDANGVVRQRYTVPLTGLDKPYEALLLEDGSLLVSEFGADRVSRFDASGRYAGSFGSKGRGPGQFVGPSSMCADGEGFVYVVDFGNQRVQKFGVDGRFALELGKPSFGFQGLEEPTGVAWDGARLLVADAAMGAIHAFDASGNYIESIGKGLLSRPEGLVIAPSGGILIADTRRILEMPLDGSGATVLYALAEGAKGRFVKAAYDANGNLLVADFDLSRVAVLTDLGSLYSGLFVRVDRVRSGSFPRVSVEFSVEDRYGKPIVGLGPSNFRLSERVRKAGVDGAPAAEGFSIASVEEFTLEWSGSNVDKLDIAFLVERSDATRDQGRAIQEAVRTIASGLLAKDSVRLVSASSQASLDAEGAAKAVAAASQGAYSADWKFDSGLRLAANALVAAGPRRAVIYIGTGRLAEGGLARYGLSQLSAYLRNNGIEFHFVSLENRGPDSEIAYLVERSGGSSMYLYRAGGIQGLGETLRKKANGRYCASFVSKADSNFGQDYLSASIEAYHLKRSGRAETGYFAPLR